MSFFSHISTLSSSPPHWGDPSVLTVCETDCTAILYKCSSNYNTFFFSQMYSRLRSSTPPFLTNLVSVSTLYLQNVWLLKCKFTQWCTFSTHYVCTIYIQHNSLCSFSLSQIPTMTLVQIVFLLALISGEWRSEEVSSGGGKNCGCLLSPCHLNSVSLSAVQGQTLTSSEPVVSRAGGAVTLSCKVEGVALAWLHWIRQKPGKGLEWIGRIDSGTGTIFAQRFQGQFSITKDTSKNVVSLEVNSVKQEDSAVYYCAREPQWHTRLQSCTKTQHHWSLYEKHWSMSGL